MLPGNHHGFCVSSHTDDEQRTEVGPPPLHSGSDSHLCHLLHPALQTETWLQTVRCKSLHPQHRHHLWVVQFFAERQMFSKGHSDMLYIILHRNVKAQFNEHSHFSLVQKYIGRCQSFL